MLDRLTHLIHPRGGGRAAPAVDRDALHAEAQQIRNRAEALYLQSLATVHDDQDDEAVRLDALVEQSNAELARLHQITLEPRRTVALMGARNYDVVAWPWDGDPNWDAPREGATYDPADEDNWRLACGECALHFPTDINLGTVAEHWKTLHFPDWSEDHQEPPIELNLVWVGLGTPPKGGPRR